MRLQTIQPSAAAAKRRWAGFTLVEVLAALMFMAIVIPVAMEGVRVASRAGEVALRKVVAVRIARTILTEMTLPGQNQSLSSSGTVTEDGLDYRWTLQSQPWIDNTMNLVSIEMSFPVQGRDYAVRLSTLTGTGGL